MTHPAATDHVPESLLVSLKPGQSLGPYMGATLLWERGMGAANGDREG